MTEIDESKSLIDDDFLVMQLALYNSVSPNPIKLTEMEIVALCKVIEDMKIFFELCATEKDLDEGISHFKEGATSDIILDKFFLLSNYDVRKIQDNITPISSRVLGNLGKAYLELRKGVSPKNTYDEIAKKLVNADNIFLLGGNLIKDLHQINDTIKIRIDTERQRSE